MSGAIPPGYHRRVAPGRRTGTVDRPVIGASWAVPIAVGVASVAALASVGGSGGPLLGPASVAAAVLAGAAVAGPWLVAAFGYGRLAGVPLLGSDAVSGPARFAIGLSIVLAAGHLAGLLGWLNTVGAWAVASPGLGAAAWSITRGRRVARCRRPRARRARWDVVALRSIAAVSLAVGIVAASNPPGWLWGSEYGGYDALSYHLPLPRQWLEMGRVWPVRTNVYSFLPSHLEAAFAMGGALTAAPVGRGDLLAGGGWRLLGIQQFHLALLVITAWLTARAARTLARSCGVPIVARGTVAAAAGALVIVTPWSVVVGSLAYNEMGVTALAAGALLVALDRRAVRQRRVWMSGSAAGWLVGLASGVKPTALLLVGPVVGVSLLWRRRAGAWPALVGAGVIAGLGALAPWLMRNWMETGNPVFPFADGLLGTGHWTEAQHARWDAAHSAELGAVDRLRLAVWTDPEAGGGAPAVERHRGMSNPQWGLLWPAAAAGVAALSARLRTRGAAGVLGLGLAGGLVVWLGLTHIQSRFLVPLLVPAAIAAGLGVGVGVGRGRGGAGPVGAAALLVLCVWQASASVVLFLGQREGRPNALLAIGPAFFTGEGLPADLAADTPERYVNRLLPEGSRVLLVGGATPLYFEASVVSSTTWDRTPLHAVADERVSRWSGRLMDLGVTHALVDFAELARLRSSGYWDERLSDERLRAWLRSGAEAVREWPGSGRVLFELRR